ncbi:MAG: putative spermidine/putrescine transport system permease protein [Actinomycetota bacterium]|jgi:putative spermidine/putrescine transport system permease protein|nr:putative spermidine/putrescine transport system permease protein [Actinomycetota bacterium]
MYLSRRARLALRAFTGLTFATLYVPLVIVAILSFDKARSFTWPPSGFTLHWWGRAATESGPRDALWMSLKTGLAATAVALVLGTLAAFALQRFRFFGRDAVSLMLVLPIALPGIVTGVALNSAFRQVGLGLGFTTLVVAHATFCIVTVFNNVIARLRRLSPNVEEASADLGADTFQTFRYVTLPLVRSALFAGGLLAFALSFDEIVVTTFTAGTGQTLPLWIFSNLFRPNQLPIVNAVATAVVVLSIVPVYLAQRLTDVTVAGVAAP